jgi:hypothetical protein
LQGLLKRGAQRKAGRWAESGVARVVNLASEFAGNLRMDDLEFIARPYSAVSAYMQVTPES